MGVLPVSSFGYKFTIYIKFHAINLLITWVNKVDTSPIPGVPCFVDVSTQIPADVLQGNLLIVQIKQTHCWANGVKSRLFIAVNV